MPQPLEPQGSRRLRHAGVLVPWANSVVEAELPMWSGASIAWHYARLVPASRSTALDKEFLSGLVGAVPAALRQLTKLPLSRVYLACTSAAFMLPDQERAAAAAFPVPVTTAFDAIVSALRREHASRVVLLTPYPQNVADEEADTLSRNGVTVTGHATLDLDDGYSQIEPEQVEALVRRVGRDAVEQAQAIVLSCTGWPTYGLSEDLARDTEKVVISSNQAMATHALTTGDCP